MSESRDKKRLGIFLLYDTKGIVHPYVEYMLSDLLTCLDELVIVSNGYLREESRPVLKKYTEQILERPNEGFDAAGWRAGMFEVCGMNKIREFDELLLINDSFFGPFRSFRKIFEEMDGRDVDFWGLSSHGPALSAQNMGPYGNRPQYIQTYFMVFRKAILEDPRFEQYWRDLPNFKSFTELVEKHGCALTKRFADMGYRWDVYSDTRDLESDDVNKNISFHMYDSYNMVAGRRLPVIKRKTFVMAKEHHLRFGMADSLPRAMAYIEKQTDYDTRLIWDYLLGEYNIYDLYQSMNLTFLPDDKAGENAAAVPATAVIAFLNQERTWEETLKRLSGLPEGADLFLLTTESASADRLANLAEKVGCRVREVRIAEDHLRELGGLLVCYRDVMERYEFVCCFCDRSWDEDYLTVERDYQERLFSNLLGGTDYIRNVIGLFMEQPQLGLLVPPQVYHGSYFHLGMDAWDGKLAATEGVLRQLCLDYGAAVSKDCPPLSTEASFWARTAALKPLLEENWRKTDIPRRPAENRTFCGALARSLAYVAQSQKYYTGTVIAPENVKAEIANLRYMLEDTQRAAGKPGGRAYTTYNSFHRVVLVNRKKSRLPLRMRIAIGLETFKQHCKAVLPSGLWSALKKIKKAIVR